jgi:hypothetical protein
MSVGYIIFIRNTYLPEDLLKAKILNRLIRQNMASKLFYIVPKADGFGTGFISRPTEKGART